MEKIDFKDHQHPGKLLVVSGMDGSGKSSMIGKLKERLALSGVDYIHTKQPTKQIRNFDLFNRYIYEPNSRDQIDYRALVCLMMGDRLQYIHSVIEPNLKQGRLVICERYLITSISEYIARGFGSETWFYELLKLVIKPDFSYYLDCRLAVLRERLSAREDARSSFIEHEHSVKLHQSFQKLIEEEIVTPLDSENVSPDSLVDRIMIDIFESIKGTQN